MQRLAWSERSAHAARFFGLRRALFWLVINRYRIQVCESKRRMNNEISDNYQKNILKCAQFGATIELVKNLQVCTMVDFVEIYFFEINWR